MGTRADFYVGIGPDAEWLGSIARDGYPDGIPETILGSRADVGYRTAVAAFLAERNDGTTPDMGWPWPWPDSATSDEAYALHDGRVLMLAHGEGFGDKLRRRTWADPLALAPDPDEEECTVYKPVLFDAPPLPDMTPFKKVTQRGARSGLLTVSVDGSGALTVD